MSERKLLRLKKQFVRLICTDFDTLCSYRSIFHWMDSIDWFWRPFHWILSLKNAENTGCAKSKSYSILVLPFSAFFTNWSPEYSVVALSTSSMSKIKWFDGSPVFRGPRRRYVPIFTARHFSSRFEFISRLLLLIEKIAPNLIQHGFASFCLCAAIINCLPSKNK